MQNSHSLLQSSYFLFLTENSCVCVISSQFLQIRFNQWDCTLRLTGQWECSKAGSTLHTSTGCPGILLRFVIACCKGIFIWGISLEFSQTLNDNPSILGQTLWNVKRSLQSSYEFCLGGGWSLLHIFKWDVQINPIIPAAGEGGLVRSNLFGGKGFSWQSKHYYLPLSSSIFNQIYI